MADYQVRKKHIEPLWDRVDRNRIGLAIFLLLFFVGMSLFVALLLFAFVACLDVAIALVFAFFAEEFARSGIGLGAILQIWGYFPHMVAVSALAVVGYMAWSLGRDERWFARRMHAKIAPKGEMLTTKYALKDMAIASGFDVAPALYVLETDNVNAFVFQHGKRRAVVGVTRGLTTRLSEGEQRAVFANLMARLRGGDMLWASIMTALMSPLWYFYEKPLGDAEIIQFKEYRDPESGRLVTQPLGVASIMYSPLSAVPVFAFVTVFVVLSELLAFGHRRSQLRHAEVADAEGMLLLKDPHSMLSALEKSVRFNNFVPTAGPGMTQLFYAWTGDSSTDDDQDPEMRRVVRLREVLGVEGMAPPAVKPNVPEFLVAPAAPRLGRD